LALVRHSQVMTLVQDRPTAANSKQDRRPHAVVIGAGFGGLAAAVRLGARGFAVTVVDKLDGPGGRGYVFRQDGFTFDAGPTIITAPFVFEELWTLCNKKMADDVTLKSLDPFYKIRFDDGSIFEATADADKMRAQIARFEPKDVAGYDRFMKVSKEIFDVAYTGLVDVPFHEISLLIKSAPDLIRLGGYRSVYSKVAQFFTNENLRIAFSFHPLFIGGNPMTASAYYCLISYLEKTYGVHYAVGGTGALARGMVKLIEGHQNQMRYQCDVASILVEDGKACGVKLTTGEVIKADLVISNAEVGWTYSKLLSETKRKKWTDQKVARADYSMSLFVWYFGTNKKFDDCDHHTIVLGPRFQGLLADIFDKKIIAEDFSLYLHRPTASDPSLAPEGCDTFYVLAPVPHLGGGAKWDEIAESFRQRVQDRLEETILPGLSGSIISSRMMTPQDFKDRLSSTNGAAFGMEPKLLQSAWFRPHNKSEDVKGLYLVGAGTHPGAGLPSVVSSAKVVDSLIPDAASVVRG
jgi:phytoene desaturase